ncbi:hypothetical protein [Roseateles sp. P5_E7]
MLDLIGLVSFLFAAALIWKRTDVAAGQRAKWSALAFLGLLAPPLLLVLFDVFFPQSAVRFMLAPFIAIAELAVPWIAFAVFSERFPKPAVTGQAEP